MGLRIILLLVVVALIAALAALNWTFLATPVAMSIGLMQVTAPLGLIMLGLTALMGLLFMVSVLYLHSTALLETRRYNKEMQAQRDLADKAETSRFTELRGYIDTLERDRSQRQSDQQAALLARIDQLEAAVKARTEQSDNSIAAHLGQIEDRLERNMPFPG